MNFRIQINLHAGIRLANASQAIRSIAGCSMYMRELFAIRSIAGCSMYMRELFAIRSIAGCSSYKEISDFKDYILLKEE